MELATPKVIQSGTSLHVSHGNDENLYVEFEMVPVLQKFETDKHGRPIYKDVAFVHIRFPGDKTKVVRRPVKEVSDLSGPSDMERFPKQWAAFKSQGQVATIGTPLEQWPLLSRSQVAELKALNIFSVDQLAAMPDTGLTWLGSRELRQQAQNFLKTATDTSFASKLTAQLENLSQEVARLQAENKELGKIKEKKKEKKDGD